MQRSMKFWTVERLAAVSLSCIGVAKERTACTESPTVGLEPYGARNVRSNQDGLRWICRRMGWERVRSERERSERCAPKGDDYLPP
jgi:hypothetical protein